MRHDQLFNQTLLLTLLLTAACMVNARDKKDSLILNRVYTYQEQNNPTIDSLQDDVYTKFRFNVEKRNAVLWLIPTTYVLAKDEREYIREAYSKVLFSDSHHYDISNQVLSSTIRKNRKAIPVLFDYLTPNIYDIALYDGHMLSPFNKVNRRFYRFTQTHQNDSTTRLDFKPKFYNTQLVNGYAIIETETGRIIKTLLNGEFDMITFRTEIQQGDEGARSLMPQRCTTAATFKFLGNRVSSLFDAKYNCDLTLPESIQKLSSREMMDSIRPLPLSPTDQKIYDDYDARHKQEASLDSAETTPKKQRLWKKIFWDTIGDNLVTPLAAESGSAYFRLSPIINPLYLSYSHNRGLRYKMKLRSRYTFSPHRYLTLNPTFGYNFKQKQFYFTAPLRMTYNPKRNGYAEVIWGNGNRISNSSVSDIIHEQHPKLSLDSIDIDKFNDDYLTLFNNIMLFDWLDLETSITMHRRKAVNNTAMEVFGMPMEYRSFAPAIGVKIQPWLGRGPLFSIDYERGIKGVKGSNLDYERWEMDGSWKYHIPGLRLLNLRAGYGFYTNKGEKYFLDYANFRDENLPEGWDDDWSGNFQLLRSRYYNVSDYYIRGNVSYESPMLFATWIPYLGKYIEKERLYVSGVLLDHSRPYYEIGYGFTNRYISLGAFASFRGTHFDRVGVEVEFELFRRW